MKNIRYYNSLYFKLATLFLIAVIALGVAEMFFATRATRRLISQINQSIEWNIASSIANQIQPELLKNFKSDTFEKLVYPYSLANPKLEFYLLDQEGKVVGKSPHIGLVHSEVDLEPITIALKDHMPDLPLYGTDPYISRKIMKGFFQVDIQGNTFSVAPIYFNKQTGYLYIIIEGNPFTRRIRMLGQFFLTRLLSFSGFGVLLGTTLLSYLLFRSITRKFRFITEAVGRYEHGDYSQPLRVKSKDEIGVLSNALNSMARRLIEAKSEIEDRDRQRRELIAKMSHDLRTPLSSIYGFLELCLENKDVENIPKLKEDLQNALNETQFQERLVEDLFELSKLEAKERDPNFDVVDLVSLVQRAVDSINIKAARKKVKVDLVERGDRAYVIADEVLISRVISNLLENALRFTPEGGSIGIELNYRDESVIVSVIDSGPGIAPEKVAKLLEAFAQDDVFENQEHRGAGLGLAIVSRILELHSSSLQISNQTDSGSCFSFSLQLES